MESKKERGGMERKKENEQERKGKVSSSTQSPIPQGPTMYQDCMPASYNCCVDIGSRVFAQP